MGFNASIYETLKSDYNDKYEYILPELTIDTNLFSNENIGNLDLQTNYKSHEYDTSKLTNFLVNDLNYYSNTNTFNNVINSKILANLKNINYESKNVNIYKNDPTSELLDQLVYQKLISKTVDKFRHKLKPKVLLDLLQEV